MGNEREQFLQSGCELLEFFIVGIVQERGREVFIKITQHIQLLWISPLTLLLKLK